MKFLYRFLPLRSQHRLAAFVVLFSWFACLGVEAAQLVQAEENLKGQEIALMQAEGQQIEEGLQAGQQLAEALGEGNAGFQIRNNFNQQFDQVNLDEPPAVALEVLERRLRNQNQIDNRQAREQAAARQQVAARQLEATWRWRNSLDIHLQPEANQILNIPAQKIHSRLNHLEKLFVTHCLNVHGHPTANIGIAAITVIVKDNENYFKKTELITDNPDNLNELIRHPLIFSSTQDIDIRRPFRLTLNQPGNNPQNPLWHNSPEGFFNNLIGHLNAMRLGHDLGNIVIIDERLRNLIRELRDANPETFN